MSRRLPGFTHADHAAAVDAILGAIVVALATGERVEIRGFGVFSTHVRTGRIGRNPRSGAAVVIPEKRVVHFRPGLAVRGAVADAGNDPQVAINPLQSARTDEITGAVTV